MLDIDKNMEEKVVDFADNLLLFISLGVIVGIASIVVVSRKKKAMERKLKELQDFSASQKIMGNDGITGIAVDIDRKKVCLIKHHKKDIELKLISNKDILCSEIFEDGETITKSARGSQIGGAIVGGLALGGVGALIGGLSGKTKSSEYINRIDLRITVNDPKTPLHDVNFINVKSKKGGITYKYSMDQARHWHGLIAVLIKHADSEDAEKEKTSNKSDRVSPVQSVSDELIKLSSLRDKGILTEEEFIAQKRKLLA